MTRFRPAVLGLALALPFTLAACGSDDEPSGDPTPTLGQQEQPTEAAQAAAAHTLEQDGPGACFALVAEHLGADTKVNEIDSSFSAGKEIDPQKINPDETPEVGVLTNCSVKYQSPDDPKKLVESRLDTKTGEFSEPAPLEITVMGDAASFDLEDHLVPLSQVDTAPLKALMDQQQDKLDGAFSTYAWSGVHLSAPDTFSADHRVRLDVKGRLVANDVLESGHLEASVDGKSVVTDNLVS